ncbi:MAG: enoyl-CoA hydratase/isomerase family protein [Gemmatimonadota bacterium]
MNGFDTLRVGRDGSVARVALARPEVRNAFDAAMIAELTACFGQLATDEELRTLVLAGEGKAFCAGADANWMRDSVDATEDENREDARRMAAMFRAIDECPVPLVGRVQGVAFGGGVGLAACCDVVVAAEDARFSFSEVRLGILPAVISTFSLAKIGRGQARRWFLTGEVFSAQRARELGLVHEVVPAAELDAAVDGIVATLVGNGPRAVREAKALIRHVRGLERDAAIEHCVETIARVRVSPEAQEGLRAFLEKRKPTWRSAGAAAGAREPGPAGGAEPGS